MTNTTPTPAPDGRPGPAQGYEPLPPGALRVGDTERNSALAALGEHLTAGRITLDEYGDRSARITVAKTADDLSELFDDLPAPHPALPVAGGTVAHRASGSPLGIAPTRGQVAAAGGDTRSTAQKLVAAAAAAAVFVAVAMFFVTGWWYWFLLIPGISAVAGSIWGPDWKDRGAPRRRDRDLGDGGRGERQLGS